MVGRRPQSEEVGGAGLEEGEMVLGLLELTGMTGTEDQGVRKRSLSEVWACARR